MKDGRRFIKLILLFTIIMGVMSLGLMLVTSERERNNRYITIDVATMRLVQLEEPKEGDPIAIVDTSLGEIRFVLYPQYSPKAVENFTELANKGYYDNTYVFDAHDGAYVGLGAVTPDGDVGDEADERVERELDQDLWPFRGAVCMVNTEFKQTLKQKILGGGTYYCGSRFDIFNSIRFDEETSKEIRDASASQELAEAFISKGGVPNFSQQNTIIGQTYKGLDVVDKLASLEHDSAGVYNRPLEDVIIYSVRISSYSKGDEAEKTTGVTQDK